MAKTTYSFSLTNERDQDLIKAIEESKKRGLNLSALLRDLLRRYFFGDPNEDLSETKIKMEEFEKRFLALKEEFNKLLEEFEEFKVRFTEKGQKVKEEERKVIEEIKTKLEEEVRKLIMQDVCKEKFEEIINDRFRFFARAYGISIKQVQEIFNTINVEEIRKERYKEILKIILEDDRKNPEIFMNKILRFAKNRQLSLKEAYKLAKEVYPDLPEVPLEDR